MFKRRGHMVIHTKSLIEVSGIALLQNSFKLHKQQGDCVYSSNTLEVLRHSREEGWQLLIDNPAP